MLWTAVFQTDRISYNRLPRNQPEGPPLSQIDLPGIWMSRSLPLAYRVLPKCGCSSVGQILHYIDHRSFYPGSIHEPDAPILKWMPNADNSEIADLFDNAAMINFTLARNPFKRLISSFADKIYGYQTNGRRYFGGHYHVHLGKYGVKWGPYSNIVDNFKIFIQFAADTIETKQPVGSDIHWTPLVSHLRYTKWSHPDWLLTFVGQVERFSDDIATILNLAGVSRDRVAPKIPRENPTSLPDIVLEQWYGPEQIEIMQRVYAEDFALLGYEPDPTLLQPVRPVDINALNAAITRSA